MEIAGLNLTDNQINDLTGSGVLIPDLVGGGGGGIGGGNSFAFSQSSPELEVGRPIRYNSGGFWQYAQSDDLINVGFAIVSEKNETETVGVNDYVGSYGGSITLTDTEWQNVTEDGNSLVSGEFYYVSSTQSGKITNEAQAIANPILLALSESEAIIVPFFPAAQTGDGNTILPDDIFEVALGTPQNTFTLTGTPEDKQYVFLTVGGVPQAVDTYSLNGNDLILSEYVSGTTVIARVIDSVSFVSGLYQTTSNFTANGSDVSFSPIVSPENKTEIDIFIDGVNQFDNTYSIVSGNIVFNSPPPLDSEIRVRINKNVKYKTSLETYFTRQQFSLSNSGVVSLGDDTAVYDLFVQDDVKNTKAEILHNAGDTDPTVITTGSLISNVKDTSGNINIYFESSSLNVQNLLGSSKEIIIYKKV